jgi:hypothetical protein
VYQIQAPPEWEGGDCRGEFWLRFGKSADPDAEAAVHLNLKKAGGSGRSVKEALSGLAFLTGGGAVMAETAPAALAYRLPAARFVGLGLCLAALLAFVPPLRPWTALGLALRLRRRAAARGEAKAAAGFDVDAVLTEWGLNPGLPRSARQAGLPAGQKPYAGGDYLSSARPETLFAITAPGRKSGLPVRRPVVRQKHITRAMQAVVLLDCSPGLVTPPPPPGAPGKAGYVVLLVRLLAGAVWQTAGSVLVVPAQRPAEAWGPRMGADDAGDLGAFDRGQAARGAAARGPTRLAPPEDLAPGHVLFLVSDLLNVAEGALRGFVGACAREGAAVRVAHVHDPADAGLVGLVRGAASGLYHDRTE